MNQLVGDAPAVGLLQVGNNPLGIRPAARFNRQPVDRIEIAGSLEIGPGGIGRRPVIWRSDGVRRRRGRGISRGGRFSAGGGGVGGDEADGDVLPAGRGDGVAGQDVGQQIRMIIVGEPLLRRDNFHRILGIAKTDVFLPSVFRTVEHAIGRDDEPILSGVKAD